MSQVRAELWHKETLSQAFRKTSLHSSHPAVSQAPAGTGAKSPALLQVSNPSPKSPRSGLLASFFFPQSHCTSRQNTQATRPDQGEETAQYRGPG